MNTKKLSLVVLLSVVPFVHAAEADEKKKETSTKAWYVTKAGKDKVAVDDSMKELNSKGFIASIECQNGDLKGLADRGYPNDKSLREGYNGGEKVWVRYEGGKVTELQDVEFPKVESVHFRLSALEEVNAADRLQALENAKLAEQIGELRTHVDVELAKTNTVIADYLKSKDGAANVVAGLTHVGNREHLRTLATTLATMDDAPFIKEAGVKTLAETAAQEKIEEAKKNITELAVAIVFAKLVDNGILVGSETGYKLVAPSNEEEKEEENFN